MENRVRVRNIRLPIDGRPARRLPFAEAVGIGSIDRRFHAPSTNALIGSDVRIARRLAEQGFFGRQVVDFASITLVPPPTVLPNS